jgi:hypothetical protein
MNIKQLIHYLVELKRSDWKVESCTIDSGNMKTEIVVVLETRVRE